MGKKKVVIQETYKKDMVTMEKAVLIGFINQPNCKVYIDKAGQYEDGNEFLIVKIDNIVGE